MNSDYDRKAKIRQSFIEAARKGDVTALASHLARGADVNTTDVDGGTATWTAAYYNQPAALKFLLRAGADPALRDDQGGTPLIWAIRNNAPDCVKTLIDGFAPLDQPNYAGVMPRDIAVAEKHPDMAQMIDDAIQTEPARRHAAAVELQEALTVPRPLTLKRGPA